MFCESSRGADCKYIKGVAVRDTLFLLRGLPDTYSADLTNSTDEIHTPTSRPYCAGYKLPYHTKRTHTGAQERTRTHENARGIMWLLHKAQAPQPAGIAGVRYGMRAAYSTKVFFRRLWNGRVFALVTRGASCMPTNVNVRAAYSLGEPLPRTYEPRFIGEPCRSGTLAEFFP